MSIGMPQSRILTPHRPRRYGLAQVIDVTEHNGSEPMRWIGGSNSVEFGTTLHNVTLTACDFAVTGWDNEEGSSASRLAFSSIMSSECAQGSGEDVLLALQATVQAEHRALLPYILETELLLGQTSGIEEQSLADLATREDPSSSVSGANIIGHAEDTSVGQLYDSIILVPISLFASLEGAIHRDGEVWRTAAGNAVAPHTAGGDVYVVPAPISLDLTWKGGPESPDFVRNRNVREVTSTLIGLFEVHHEVVVFDPQT